MSRINKIISIPVILMVVVVAILVYSWHYTSEAYEGPAVEGMMPIVPDYTPEGITAEPDPMKNRVIPVFLLIMGIGVAGIWTVDLLSDKFSGQGNFFQWKEGENMLWPHLVAEYLMAAGLITGGIGLYLLLPWAVPLSLFSLGAIVYSAINSTGWVIARKERIGYGIPMWICLAGAIFSMFFLIHN
jgi:hypothetical protein